MLGLSVSSVLSAQNIKDGLTFYAPFNGDLNPVIAKGSDMALPGKSEIDFVQGKSGEAVKTSGSISYIYNANLTPQVGTVAFWHNPEWTPGENPKGNKPFGLVHIVVSYISRNKALFFMTGATFPAKGFKWDYGCQWGGANKWKPGSWQHIAISWDKKSGNKSMYINGKLVKKNSTPVIPTNFKAGSKMQLGNRAPGLYDELYVYNRVLSPEEIGILYKSPAKAAKLVTPESQDENESSVAAKLQLPVDDLNFYIPFNKSIAPHKASGNNTAKAKEEVDYSKGIVNSSLKLKGSRVNYNSKGNIDITKGTLGFWIKLDKTFKEIGKPVTLYRSGHFALTVQPDKKQLYFMTGMDNGEYFRWDYSPQSSHVMRWKVGEWHHMAVTWEKKSGRKELYLDGKLLQSKTSGKMPPEIQPLGELYIGDNLYGEIDELVYFNKPMAGWVIAALCAEPEKLAAKEGIKVNNSVKTIKFQKKAMSTLRKAAKMPPVKFDIVPVKLDKTLVAPGETFSTNIPARNPSIKPYNGKVTFTLRDFWMNDCGKQEVDLKLAPGDSKQIKVSFTPKLQGVYKVEAVYDVDGKKKLCDLSSFACFPKPGKPDPESFFGNHVNGWNDGKYLKQAARLGQNWQRNHNMIQTTWWFKVQPDPGKFKWTYDFQLKSIKKYKMPLLGQLFTTPHWAANPPQPKPKPGYNKCWNPNLKEFENYVYKTVSRYKDYIKYWEIWNEPAVGMFWRGDTNDFAKMVQTAIRAAKKADPDCVVMSAGYTYSAWAWHKKAAEAGAFKNLDMISIHWGTKNGLHPSENYEKLGDTLEHFQGLAIKYGDGKKLPIWSTEGGSGDTTYLRGLDYPQLPPEKVRPPLNWHKGAIRTVQGEAVLISRGVGKHFIYHQNGAVNPSNSAVFENTAMLGITAAPRPKLMARVVMQQQLDWTKFIKRVYREKDGRFWANVHQDNNGKGSVVMFWCGDNGKLEISVDMLDKVEKVLNIMGNPINFGQKKIKVTGEPGYIHISAPAKDVVKALEKAKIKIIKAPVAIEKNVASDKPKVPPQSDYVAPAEKRSANFTVDLRKYCNMGFADDKAGNSKGGWSDEGSFNDMRDFKVGKRRYFGVDFDIIDPAQNEGKSLISLYASRIALNMPKKVTIPLNRKVRTLYFMHAAAWGSPGNIAEYILHYQDGSKQTCTVNIPKNNNNWWNGHDKNEISRVLPVRVSNTAAGKPAWRYVRVFELEADKTGVPVKSIELVSMEGIQTPMIIAISGTSW